MKLIASLLIFALAGQSLWGETPDHKHIEKIRHKVSQCIDDGRHVSVETYDNHKVAGTIIRAAQDDFVLINADNTVTLRYGSVKKIKSPMDPRRRSAIVALVVLGGLMGTALAAAANDR
ncbi:MAG TPA: hypothetical protein VFF39_19385 [Verrucomicrobiae bacterium]|nr:hypothetical protein [Verrucomicrobiae bacterium]